MAATRKKSGTKKKSDGAKKDAAKRPARKASGSSKAPSRAAAAKRPTTRTTTRTTTRVVKPKAAEAPASQRVAIAVAEAALDKKALNVEIIDVAGKVDYADYVVVMSGTSDRQVSALARGIAEDVESKTKNKCLGVEGLPGGAWVLMDFGDVVVHIFHHDVRGYYDLESLWIDAARVPVPGAPPS